MRSGRRALVTGAGGFVGSHVVDALAAAGWQVLAQDRVFDPDRRAAWRHGAAPVEITETPLAALPPLEVDGVIHAATVTAGPGELRQTPEANFRANLDPLLAALEWAARSRARRVIVLSSSAIFRATEPGPVEETLPASPLGLYAVAKLAAEGLAETLRTEFGRDVIAARLSNIYGPRERAGATRPRVSVVAGLVSAALAEGRVTVYRDDPARDWTYAPDVGRALVRLLEAPSLAHPLYHVAGGQARTPVEIAQALAAILPGLQVETRDGPNPQIPALTRRGTLCSDRLRDEIGFEQWTPFEEGLRSVVSEQKQAVLLP